MVVPIQHGLGVGLRSASEMATGDQQRLDHPIVQDDQGGQSSEPLRHDLVAARSLDLVDQVPGAMFLQVIGGAARPIFGLAPAALGMNSGGQLGSRKTVG